MTKLLSVLLACACSASAKQPAKRPSARPDAPSASRQAKETASRAKTLKELRGAVFLPKPALPLRIDPAEQRLEKFDLAAPVGHRDVTAQAEAQPGTESFDAFAQGGLGPYNRSKTASVELSFMQPAPRVTVGVGYGKRKEWLGNDLAVKQSAAFAVLRITLGPSEPKPTFFTPEARLSKRRDFQGEKVQRYTVDDLPPALRP